MIGLRRNEQTIHYALYNGKTMLTDAQGNKTGEYTLAYGTLAEMQAVLAPVVGTAEREVFGVDVDYDRTALIYDTACPITEESIVWVDVPTSGKHDYIVKKIAKSLNTVVIALKKVNVG